LGCLTIDPQHDSWGWPDARYLFEERRRDSCAVHDIRATVFAECRSIYRGSGPEAMRSLGEKDPPTA
jgi:L-fuconolactonase